MSASPKTAGTIVVGAGFAGLSAAYHLSQSREGGVLVLESDEGPGLHASGKNAGMIRQTVSDPILAHLARLGRDALAAAQSEGWKLDFRSEGSLLLAQKWDEDKLRGIAAAAARESVPHRWFDRAESARLVPLLADANFTKALYCPTDGKLSIEALIKGFTGALKERGVPIFYGHSLESIEKNGRTFTVRAGGAVFEAPRVVNAAGAWAGDVGAKAGASDVPLSAYRRHLFISHDLRVPVSKWPFVWDLTHDLYFRAVREGMMMSPCDKVFFPAKNRPKKEGIDPGMKAVLQKKLDRFSPSLSKLKIHEAKAALRTMTPDGRFVIGEDPVLENFFWLAGLGGHGVTTSFSVGRLVADLALGRRVNPVIAKALSPARFAPKRRKAHAAA